jgi:hypothetical protein
MEIPIFRASRFDCQLCTNGLGLCQIGIKARRSIEGTCQLVSSDEINGVSFLAEMSDPGFDGDVARRLAERTKSFVLAARTAHRFRPCYLERGDQDAVRLGNCGYSGGSVTYGWPRKTRFPTVYPGGPRRS